MAVPTSGDPGGEPVRSQRSVRLFPAQSSSPSSGPTRVTRASKRRKDSAAESVGNNRTFSFEFAGNNEERGTNFDEIAWLIADLKKTIIEQNKTIGNVQAELAEVKLEQANLKDQNSELQNEIRSLRTQLSTCQTPPLSPRSWASVAAGGGAAPKTTNLPRATDNGDRKKEPICLRISTAPKPVNSDGTEPSFTRYLPAESANSYIRNALGNTDTTKDVQVAGVGTTKTGYIIRFKDPQSAETARNNAEWLDQLGNSTKLVKPRFGIVVHRVPTAGFSLPGKEKEGIQKIMDDNELEAKGFQVSEIAWLKKPDKPVGAHASMGIWLNTAEAAEWTVNNGLLVGQQYIGSVEHYQIKQKRCYRCQRVGHLAWSCKERARCGHCAGEHEGQNCIPGTRPRCVDCGGPHPTGDRNCQGYTSAPTS